MNHWPSVLPTPTIEGYALNVDMGLTRTEMEKGIAKQRRRYRTMPTKATVQFAVSQAQFTTFQNWVHSFGFEWFEMNLTSFLGKCVTHEVRFITDLGITPINDNAFTIAAMLEIRLGTAPAVLSDDWIISGNVTSASSPDWWIAKTPPSPSTDTVIGGSPKSPSAYV